MITGLLIAEINIAMIQNSSRESQEGGSEKRLTLVSMAGTMLGSGATLLTSGVYLFRSYALMQACECFDVAFTQSCVIAQIRSLAVPREGSFER